MNVHKIKTERGSWDPTEWFSMLDACCFECSPQIGGSGCMEDGGVFGVVVVVWAAYGWTQKTWAASAPHVLPVFAFEGPGRERALSFLFFSSIDSSACVCVCVCVHAQPTPATSADPKCTRTDLIHQLLLAPPVCVCGGSFSVVVFGGGHRLADD
jgi:hypothetical protein